MTATRKRIGDVTPKEHRVAARSKANLKPAWAVGQSGNPAGRPKGSRNKLCEAFLADFCEAWKLYGVEALRKIAKHDPAAFVRFAVAILPSQIETDEERVVYVISDRPITPEEWAEKWCKESPPQ